jgi:hypothetical protein
MTETLRRRDLMASAGLVAGAGLFGGITGCQRGRDVSANPAEQGDYSGEEYVWLCCHVNLPLFKAHDHPALDQVGEELGVGVSIQGPDTNNVRELITAIEQTAAR